MTNLFLWNPATRMQKATFLQSRELAAELYRYTRDNISSKCPPHLRSAENVAKWLKEAFLDKTA